VELGELTPVLFAIYDPFSLFFETFKITKHIEKLFEGEYLESKLQTNVTY
jgi:hypothetical protein